MDLKYTGLKGRTGAVQQCGRLGYPRTAITSAASATYVLLSTRKVERLFPTWLLVQVFRHVSTLSSIPDLSIYEDTSTQHPEQLRPTILELMDPQCLLSKQRRVSHMAHDKASDMGDMSL